MKTLGNIILIVLVLLFIGSILGVLTGATQLNPLDVLPVLSIYVLITIVLILTFIKMNKKNEIKQNKISNPNETSLSKAVYNHSKDIANEIKPTINEYKERHSTTKNENQTTKIMNSEINEDEIYEKIMIEIEEDKKVKSTWAKALAQSDGDDKKAESLYINLRVQHIQEEQQRQIEIKKNQEKLAKLATLGGKELNKPEKDFLNKYGVDIFSSNVNISSYSIEIHTSSGTKLYHRG